MKIKLLEPMGVNGDHCLKGDVVDVKEQDAYYLVNSKKAELFKETKPKPKAKK